MDRTQRDIDGGPPDRPPAKRPTRSAVPHSAPASADGPGPHGPVVVDARHATPLLRPPTVTQLPCPTPQPHPDCFPADNLSPAHRYDALFVAVQTSRLFADSKTFVDCVPRMEPEAIVERYRAERHKPAFSLPGFVRAHFLRSEIPDSHYVSDPAMPLQDHIESLWPVLTRKPADHPLRGSLLPLPHRYLVPGGRFSEMYYWDSYFTLLGMPNGGSASGPTGADMTADMVRNMAWLLDVYGMVPNGTRTYYLSRSQPPVFAMMLDLLEAQGHATAGDAWLPSLQREHAFWMDGARTTESGMAQRRVVRLRDGALLNRYWDDLATPREESFLEDVATARRASRPAHLVFRDLRAAAESGWDFSSRWLDIPPMGKLPDMATIRTTAIVPIDLNALLWHMERRLAAMCERLGDAGSTAGYRAQAEARQAAIDRHLWHAGLGAFIDHDWHRNEGRDMLTAATVVPLFVGLASQGQAQAVAATIERRLLRPGGLATTLCRSGQQWDRPNGWAPVQWMAIEGLRRYGFDGLAGELARRWLLTVGHVYGRAFKLVEKYRLAARPAMAAGGGGGEYPLQDGFGWTNGVVAALIRQYGDPLPPPV